MTEINKIYNEDCLTFLKSLPDNYVNCCVTSPPYYGLRDYGVDGQIGLEETPEAYVEKMVAVFREVRRVLKDDGIMWLNLGDSYWGSGTGKDKSWENGKNLNSLEAKSKRGLSAAMGDNATKRSGYHNEIKPKDLIGIPWMVAFAIRADGWYLRQDIIWHKPNPMPESVTDRCTKAHEYIFLMSKSARYYYDADAIKERSLEVKDYSKTHKDGNKRNPSHLVNGFRPRESPAIYEMANKRSVWVVNTHSYTEAHFATFPEDLIVPCIKAGCPEGGIVLDPFMGAGTTALVAYKLNRNYIGSEINPDYCKIAEKRLLPHKMQQKLF